MATETPDHIDPGTPFLTFQIAKFQDYIEDTSDFRYVVKAISDGITDLWDPDKLPSQDLETFRNDIYWLSGREVKDDLELIITFALAAEKLEPLLKKWIMQECTRGMRETTLEAYSKRFQHLLRRKDKPLELRIALRFYYRFKLVLFQFVFPGSPQPGCKK